jgi:hypothetical protein
VDYEGKGNHMNRLTEPQSGSVEIVQARLATAKTALLQLSNQAGLLREAMAASGTPAALKAGNAAMRLQGIAMKLRGELIAAHADASDALMEYDAETGTIVVMGGGGGR